MKFPGTPFDAVIFLFFLIILFIFSPSFQVLLLTEVQKGVSLLAAAFLTVLGVAGTLRGAQGRWHRLAEPGRDRRGWLWWQGRGSPWLLKVLWHLPGWNVGAPRVTPALTASPAPLGEGKG